jgi:uncharacterized repeat protein (TIGR01451 family)
MLIKQQMRRVRLAVVALALVGSAPSAFADLADTNFDIDITNRASVNYSVSGVPQTVIRSAPGPGNSTPGINGGADTTFKVDKKLMFVAEETDGAATVTSPGLANVVTVFRVTNTSNGAQDFKLTASNPTAPPVVHTRTDNANMTPASFRTRVSAASCVTTSMTTPAYAGETTAYIEQLGENACKYVFVLADTLAGAANNDFATIMLAVQPTTNLSDGVTLEAPSGVADDPSLVDVVFAESGNAAGNTQYDGISFAYDQYIVGTLTVTKTAAVISDGFSLPGQYKAIPGAVVEYTISVQNNGLVTSGASLTEVIPTNTVYVAGSTTLNGAVRADVSGTMPFVGGGTINSPSAAAGVINPGSGVGQIAVVKFRVTIP